MNRCLLILALQFTAVMLVQSALEFHYDPDMNELPYYIDKEKKSCVLFCRVHTDNNESLDILPRPRWFRKKTNVTYESLHQYVLNSKSLVHLSGMNTCVESNSDPGVYRCDLKVDPCPTLKFYGQFKCVVMSLDDGSSVSMEMNIESPSQSPDPLRCFMPEAENLTVQEIHGNDSTLSVNLTWDVTKKPSNEEYCEGSRRWDVKITSSSTPQTLTDRKPTSADNFVTEGSAAVRSNTTRVFDNLSRSMYYLFEVRNRKKKKYTLKNIADEYYQYASYIYYFGAQEYPVITAPHEETEIRRVREGDITTLTCVGSGKPTPTAILRSPVPGIVPDVVSESNTAVITLVDVTPSHAGEYTCNLTSTFVNPPFGKRLVERTKKYDVKIISRDQPTEPPTGLRCTSLQGSTCSAYIHRSVDIFFNNTNVSTDDVLKTLAESRMRTIQSLNSSNSDSCIPFLEAIMCHTLFPYCDRTTGTPTPRPICKSACDIFAPNGPCGHMFENHQGIPSLYQELSSRCDTRVNPAGSTPECIPVFLEHPRIRKEDIKTAWCSKGNGRNFNGDVAHTRNGYQCQSWSHMSPHRHPLSSAEFPVELGFAHYNCRNPGGLGKEPWCYTTNSSVRWDYCDVPQCDVCEEYSGDFCRDLPLYNVSSNGVFYHQETIVVFVADTLETRMKSIFKKLDGATLAGGCQLALRQLLCHSVVPLCKMQVNPAPKDVCSDHCHLVDVLQHCLGLDPIQYLKENNINSQLSLPNCPGERENENSQECVPSPVRIPPPQESSMKDCYTVADHGHSYTGNANITVSGRACIAWDSNTTHVFKSIEYPELIGAANYCRNPGQVLIRPWCFTSDSPLTWEYCDLQACVESSTSEPNTATLVATEPQHGNPVLTIVPVIVTIIGALILVVVVVISNCVCYAFRKKANIIKSKTPLSPTLEQYRMDSAQSEIKFIFNDQYVMTQALASKVAETIKTFQQYDRNNIKYIKQIGQGNFGVVYLGRAADLVDGDEDTLVAVKTLKEETSHESLEEFVREAKIMLSFDHPNIIKLHGVCMQDLPYCLIFEYMNRGDLANFLRENASSAQRRFMSCDRPRSRTESTLSDDPPTLDTEQLTDICKQIAAGMEYLSMMNHVHRDLACRNCLVRVEETIDNDGEMTSLGNTIIKIGDFGMSHNLYSHNYYRVRGQAILPVRWMAPESIIYGKFTTAADVWSFGVVMWEVFSFGLQPYYGTSNDEVTDAVRRGKKLSQPNNCPRKMFQIMNDCWNMDQELRPTFTELHNILNEARSSISSYSDDGSSCRSSSPSPSDEMSDDAFLEENSVADLKVDESLA